jgi:hypothetical protein
MYKPNFCAECGEKITRSRWPIYTSRSFCTNCEGRFSRARILVPVITAALLFSVGLMIGRATRTAPPPLTVQRGELPTAAVPLVAAKTEKGAADVEPGDDSSSSTAAPKPEPKYGPDGTANERPTDPNEVVSICGARTQKGTPCQRRVRGTGRCWQHRGMPAILPPSKLIVTEK